MKTIKQIANEIGVSQQSVYRRLSAVPSETLSTNNKGVQLINTDGEALLKAALSEKVSSEQSADNITDTFISMLQKELEAKNEQLTTKDKQISDLTEANKSLSQSINAARQNELAETIIDGQMNLPELPSHKKEKQRQFWQFWKK